MAVLEGLGVLEGAGFEVCGSAGGAETAGRDGNCWRGQSMLEGQRVLKRLRGLER